MDLAQLILEKAEDLNQDIIKKYNGYPVFKSLKQIKEILGTSNIDLKLVVCEDDSINRIIIDPKFIKFYVCKKDKFEINYRVAELICRYLFNLSSFSWYTTLFATNFLVPTEEFIKIYSENKDVKYLSEYFGVPERIINNKIFYLKKHGKI